ncbi:LuxR family transcriptional regulator [Pseudonocardiaceae bacterium YIM PH 21723]|nr:LuxR family transcriptional regulator [Pseudonocardiaceae bacterium YIM PH 21723]
MDRATPQLDRARKKHPQTDGERKINVRRPLRKYRSVIIRMADRSIWWPSPGNVIHYSAVDMKLQHKVSGLNFILTIVNLKLARYYLPMAGSGSGNLLIGREAELTRVISGAHAAIQGTGRAIVVEGEPGIGKSALIRAGCVEAERLGCQAFWGSADELSAEIPLLPMVDGLKVREPSPGPAGARRDTIARLLRGELAASGGDLPAALAEQLIALVGELSSAAPTVLVIDDLQWADPATVSLWSRLSRVVDQQALLLVGIMRSGAGLDRLTARAEHLILRQLPEQAVLRITAELAGGTPGERLRTLTGGAAGNPLYITELIDVLVHGESLRHSGDAVELCAESVPDSLSAAIAGRLDFLAGDVREILVAATLLSRSFSILELSVVAGRPVADLVPALESARALGVIREVKSGFAFRHPLIRSALYDSISEHSRSAWHLEVARELARANVPVDRVARQLLRTMDLPGNIADWLPDWLTESAGVLVSHAPKVAARLLGSALSRWPAERPRNGFLMAKQADALYRTGDMVAAEQAALLALDCNLGPEEFVDLHSTLALCRGRAGRLAESLRDLESALDRADLDPVQAARLTVLIARTRFHLGDLDASQRVAESALRVARQAGNRAVCGWALQALTAVHLMRGELDECLPLFREAFQVIDGDAELSDLQLLLRMNEACVLHGLGRDAEVEASAVKVLEIAEQIGSQVRLAQARTMLAELRLGTGDWDAALIDTAAMSDEDKAPINICIDRSVAAIIGLRRGNPALAAQHLQLLDSVTHGVENLSISAFALARSLAREFEDDPVGALAVLMADIDGNAQAVEENEQLFADAVRLAVLTGDPHTAELVTVQAEQAAAGSELARKLAVATHCRGRLDGDAHRLLTAADLYRQAGRPLPRAQAFEAAAVLFAGQRDTGSAKAAFSRAWEIYSGLGANWDLGRLQAVMRECGIRRGPRAKHAKVRSGWDALTPAEAKVTELVAQGLSNPQIAARLFLSPRTVSTHVSHILAKLGLSSRIDVAREVSRRLPASG